MLTFGRMTTWKKTFICAFAAQTLSIVGFSFALPFLPFFIRELGVTDPAQQAFWAGVTLAATGVTLAAFAPIWGWLADRYGRKSMVIRSMFGGTVVLILMSFAQSINQLLIFRLLQGALTGTVSASVALVASVTPPRRSGFTLGMMQAAVLLGVAIGPLIGGIVADTFGYRAAFRAGALLVFLGGLMVYYGAREPAPERATESERASQRAKPRRMFSSTFLAAVLILFAVRFSNTLVNPAFPLIVQDFVVSMQRLNSITGSIMAMAGLAGAVSAAFLGHIGDRIGHRRIVILCSVCAAVTSAAHALAGSLAALTVAHLLFGLSVAGTMPAANTMIQRSTDPRHMGKAFGAASALGLIGLALGPLLGGFLAREYGLRSPFLVAAGCQFTVAAMVLLVSRIRPERTGLVPVSPAVSPRSRATEPSG